MTISKCVICGKEFVHKNPRAMTCSDECRLAKKRADNMNVEQVCVYCGKKFIGSVSQTYCSDECRAKGKAMRMHKQKSISTMKRLNEIAKEASRNGLSYGEYVAREKI